MFSSSTHRMVQKKNVQSLTFTYLPSCSSCHFQNVISIFCHVLHVQTMTLNITLRVALGSGIIFTTFYLRQLIRVSIIAFLCWYVMSCCELDLWPVDLKVRDTLNVMWSNYVRNLNEIEQSRAELLIIAHVIFDLDPWPVDLELLQPSRRHAFTLCTKCERNRIIHGWVIDHLARFRV